jgi:ribosomal protein S18 acetylase RimI-like enzyme
VILPEGSRFESDPEEVLPRIPLPDDWTVGQPDPADQADVDRLTHLLRAHERHGRGWAGASVDDVLVEVSERGLRMRENVVLRDGSGQIRAWGSVHDRSVGRMLFVHIVERDLPAELADTCSDLLVEWAAGFERVRTWWQMSRPVTPDEADLVESPAHWEEGGVVFRLVRRGGSGMPDETDLRELHEVLEGAFVDHFNSSEETFEEFLFRLREDPGHRWDHWWLAELTDEETPQPVGALIGTVSESANGPDGSYVSYLGVLEAARGRGVAKGLLRTIIADAAARGRDRVGLEVDADSPTGAAGLYTSMDWKTKYVTESWHRDVPVS